MLKDCSPIDVAEFAKTYFGKNKSHINEAIEWLKLLSQKRNLDFNTFNLTDTKNDAEPIVYTHIDGQWWTGRFIGSIYFKGKSIEIYPRFELEFVANNMPMNNFIPVEINASFKSGKVFKHYIQALIWLHMLTKAAKHALPTIKTEQRSLSSVVRGRIDVRQTIKSRIKHPDKVTSVTTRKKIDNPVSLSIVLAFYEIQTWFPGMNLQNWLPEVISQRLQSLIDVTSRHSSVPSYKEINNSRLGSIARFYKPLSRLSLDILAQKGHSEVSSNEVNQSILLDVAELWEIYVLAVLRESVPINHEVRHGALGNDSYLLTDMTGNNQLGKLLPDYIINKNNHNMLIADAKYKRIGDEPWLSPKRDDLYQMTAYLSKYDSSKDGILFYPRWQDDMNEKCKILKNNPWKLSSGQNIYFIALPTIKNDALKYLKINKFFC